MRVAIYQYDIESDPEKNLTKISSIVEAVEGVDLLVLPEVCLTGFGAGKEALVVERQDRYIQRFIELAAQMEGKIAAGLRFREEEKITNRSLLIGPSGIEHTYDKRQLFRYWQEHHLFEAGDKEMTMQMGEWQVAPRICYELRFPELFRENLGTHLFLVQANWPGERREHWLTLLRARAIENQAYVVGSNRIGYVGKTQFTGDSVIFGPTGDLLLDLEDHHACSWVDLDLASLARYRKQFPSLEEWMQGESC